jgi:hypothetical protein
LDCSQAVCCLGPQLLPSTYWGGGHTRHDAPHLVWADLLNIPSA